MNGAHCRCLAIRRRFVDQTSTSLHTRSSRRRLVCGLNFTVGLSQISAQIWQLHGTQGIARLGTRLDE